MCDHLVSMYHKKQKYCKAGHNASITTKPIREITDGYCGSMEKKVRRVMKVLEDVDDVM